MNLLQKLIKVDKKALVVKTKVVDLYSMIFVLVIIPIY
jgi:hypothetical protein